MKKNRTKKLLVITTIFSAAVFGTLFNFNAEKIEASSNNLTAFNVNDNFKFTINGKEIPSHLILRFANNSNESSYFTKYKYKDEISLSDGTYNIYDLSRLTEYGSNAHTDNGLEAVGMVTVKDQKIVDAPIGINYNAVVLIKSQNIETIVNGGVENLNQRTLRFVDANNENFYFTINNNQDKIPLLDGSYNIYDLSHLGTDSEAHKGLKAVGTVTIKDQKIPNNLITLEYDAAVLNVNQIDVNNANSKIIRFVDVSNEQLYFTKFKNQKELKLLNGNYKIYDITEVGNHSSTAHSQLTPIGEATIKDQQTNYIFY